MKIHTTHIRGLLAITLSVLLMDPAGLWTLARAAQLEGVAVQPDELTIQTSGGVRYNSFVTAHPPRLVVELLDTTTASPSKTIPGKGRFLTRVRAGQFAAKPKPVSRVVLYLSEQADYRVEERGKDLVVTLTEKTAAPEPNASLKDAPVAAPAQSQLSDKMPPEPAMVAEPEAAESPKTVSTAKPDIPKTKRAGDIIDSLPTELDDFHADGMDIRDVFRLLGEKAKINIVYGPDVAGILTLHLTQVSFRDIFRTVLNMQGLVTEQVGDKILRVMTPAVYQAARQQAVAQTKVFSLNYAKALDIRQQLDTIRATEGRRGSTVTDATTNSVIVTDSPEGLEQAARLISQLDRRPRQVLIEAKLVEVELNKAAELGIRWSMAYADQSTIGNQRGANYAGFLNSADKITNAAGATIGAFPFNANASRGTGVNLPISGTPAGAIGFGRMTNTYQFDAQIQAAASNGKAKILSDPKVATLNNQKAVIQITTQLPYVTSTLTSNGVAQQNVSFLTTGITLTVTPTINADGYITLQVKPEVSRPGIKEPLTGARGANSRSAETTVLVRNGETIVIGGLISDSMSDSVSKVPLLGDIPLLGWLFKSKSSDRSRQELLVFVTTRTMD